MGCSIVGVIIALILSMLAAPLAANAQPVGKLPRLGILAPGTPPGRAVEALRQGLRDLGYVEGQTIALEIRWDEGKPERSPDHAAELVALHVDILVTGTGVATGAAKHATGTIPIVMASHPEPVERGHVASLARPGGNITGLSLMTPEMNQKRLELLKEALPGLVRVAVLWDGAFPATRQWDAFETAAHGLGIALRRLEVRGPDDLRSAFAAARGDVQAVITGVSPLFFIHRAQVAALALQHRLPLMSGEPGVAEAGGLMTYGPNIPELWRRAAVYVDKILKGAKPADLPVEQPRKFEFVINLKTAQTLGLMVPPHLLVFADEVLQ
jgi:putative tryptophan/tyrosine transport system substrate-binding protein